MTRTRIMLADDHTLFRQGIANLIAAESDMEVVGEAANGNEAVLRAGEVRPDLVLMDIGMPELNGLDATRQVLNISPQTEVLILTMHQSDEVVEEVLKAGVKIARVGPIRLWHAEENHVGCSVLV